MNEHRTLAQFAAGVQARTLADLRAAQPAEVVAYDPTTQTAELRFPLPRQVLAPDGEAQLWVQQPNVDGARVLFPGSGQAGLSWPVLPGARGLFVPFEQSADEYTPTGTAPRRVRSADRHTLGCGGVFYPSPLADVENVPAAAGATVLAGDDVRLAEAAATEAIARADRAEAELAALAGRVYFLESWASQLVTTLAATWYTTLVGLNPLVLGVPAFYQAQNLPPAALPVAPALGGPLAGSDTPPPAYVGTGPVGCDKVKGV